MMGLECHFRGPAQPSTSLRTRDEQIFSMDSRLKMMEQLLQKVFANQDPTPPISVQSLDLMDHQRVNVPPEMTNTTEWGNAQPPGDELEDRQIVNDPQESKSMVDGMATVSFHDEDPSEYFGEHCPNCLIVW